MSGASHIGEGFAFPVVVDEEGRIVRATDTAVIDRSIELILSTARGERLMRPDFGSTLHTFLFKPLNEATRGRMATAVKQALQQWEPRIRLLSVAVGVAPGDGTTALINVEYVVRPTHTRHSFVFPFYLDGQTNAAGRQRP
jgi:uncharacterized protein